MDFKKIPCAKSNGNGDISVNKNVWHFFSKYVTIIWVSMLVLAFLWGKLKGVVVSNENVEKIPAMALKINSIDERVLMTEEKVKPIENMRNDITELKVSVGEISGKIDVLLTR